MPFPCFRCLCFRCNLSWAKPLSFVFLGGCDFGEHLSEQPCLYCFVLYTNIYFRFVSISTTNNFNWLITCSTIFSDEVLHLHLIAISPGFQDINGQNNTHRQICDIYQAANMPLCCHLCLLLYFFVQNCRPFGPFFSRLGILSVQRPTARGKADPAAAAGNSRQNLGGSTPVGT